MATEELIVLLDARTAKLDAKLNSTNAKLDSLDVATKKADTNLNKMSASAKTVGKSIGIASIAVTALTAGTVALIRQTTVYAKELKIAAQLSGVAAKELQSIGFATSTVGIGMEKLGDISKDTREKIGNFTSESKGGFADFAVVMGLTTVEASALAKEFETLSGPDVLQEMVTRMQEAGVSTQEMSFALEGMASDTTNLIPLLIDGGKGMRELRNAMEGVTVPLTDEDLKKLADLDAALNLAAESATSLASQALVDLSDWFVNAANAASFFFASLNEGSRADLQTDLLPVLDDIQEIESKLSRASGSEKVRLTGLLEKLVGERKAITDALAALDATTAKPEVQSTDKTVNTGEGSRSGALNPDEIAKRKQAVIDSFKTEQELLKEKYVSDQELFAENKEVLLQLESQYKEKLAELNTDNSLESIRDRYKSEEELLQEKFERELEMIGENDVLKKERQAQFIEDMVELDQRYLDEKKEAEEKSDKGKIKSDTNRHQMEQKLSSKNVQSLMSIASSLVGHNSSIGKALFLASQGLAASQVFFNTEVASMRALAELGPIAGAPVAAAIKTSGYISMAAIAASTIGGLTGGSGGGSVGGGSGGGSSNQQQQQDNFVPESTSLLISDSTATSSTQGRISFSDDSGDDILDAIARGLNKGQSEGRFS